MLKHVNISIFVPNNGCKHMCSFCNQVKITSKNKQPDCKDIDEAVKNLKIKEKVFKEIAFFGGSFTAIERSYMEKLLLQASKHIKSGEINGIRISTRPDCIDENILKLLKYYGVTSIELGAQSMVDSVLSANKRGHTAEDVKRSSILIKERGFQLGLQMMTGLYMSKKEDDLFTAKEFIKLMPSTVRVYPTLVVKNTHLNYLFESGIYKAMSLDEAVNLCSEILNLFNCSGINVIRLGLHSCSKFQNEIVSGPWHPAFRELCESKIMVDKCISLIKYFEYQDKKIKITVSETDLSKIIGQKKAGINRIKKFCKNAIIEKKEGLKSGSLFVEECKI